MKILMVAAENDAIPGGKVGGIGDVVRDIPPALEALGLEVVDRQPRVAAGAHRPVCGLRSASRHRLVGRG